MAIKFVSVKCPECGAALDVEEGRKQIFCSYCGSKVMIENDNEYIYRHIDEAGIKQAETDRMVRMRELDFAEKQSMQGNGVKKVLTSIWIVLSLIIVAICIIKISILDDFMTGFLMLFYIGGPVIGGGGYLIFKLMPEKENEKVMLSNGGIRFPKSIVPYSDKNYEVIQQALLNAGFHNVKCVNLHDVKLGLLQKPGQVESITVNGERLVSGGKVYSPDVSIIVTYHGK